MRNIFKYFIEHPKLVNLLLVLVLIMGAISFANLKRNSLPNVDFKMVFITTVYPGASPKDVEINVTIPLEEQIQSVTGIKKMSSYSTENFSNIFIELDPDARDLAEVKDNITKAVERVANLPKEVKDKPIITELKSDIFPVFEVAISGDKNISELELRRYAKNFEKKISLLPGVGGTKKMGYRKREVQIKTDLKRASQHYISVAEIQAAIRGANIRLSAGNIDLGTTKKKVITLAEFEKPTDVKDVIVRSVFSGQRILVSDIAEVQDDFEKQNKIIKTNGQNCISITVSKKENADAVRVAQRIKAAADEYNKTLPAGIKTQVIKDFSVYVNSMLQTVIQNAIVGFILVLLCLMIFLDPKVAFWTSLGIPFSLLVTFNFMPVYDISVTSISLLAIVIVLGMLVDDAIVVAEHIYSNREKGMEPIEAAVKGVSDIFWPVVATVTTTIAAFIPILLMGGIMGEWVRAIPIVVTVILLASLFESAFILPSHMAHTKIRAKAKPRLLQFLERTYQKRLSQVLKHKYLVVGFFVLVFIVAVAVVLPIVGFDLHPSTDNNLLQIKIETPKGTPIEETERRVTQLENIIAATIPKEILTSYVTTIGEKGTEIWESATSVSQSHWARIIINLTPREKRKISVFQIGDQLRDKFKPLENKNFAKLDVLSKLGGPPVGKAIDITIIGNNDKIRTKLADELVNFIATNKAVYDISRDDEKGLAEINIKLNRSLMAQLGVSANEVAQLIRAGIDGNVVTSLRQEGEEIDYRVVLADKFKGDPKLLKNLTIPNRMGKLIRLGSFISFEEKATPMAIWHLEGDNSVSIRAEMDSKQQNPNEFNKIIKNKFTPIIKQYPDFRIKFGGYEQSTNESMADFFFSLIVALVVIYIILVVLFNSFTQPMIVMSAIPFGLVGVILAFALHWQTVTFMALIGMLGLSGVVVNNSLVMLKFLNDKQSEECHKQEDRLSIKQVVEAATLRFRPIILTTITTVVGLLPSLYGFIGGIMPQLFPLLLAIAWGLMFSTFITLILIPAFYLIEQDFSSWVYSKFKK